MAPWGTSKRSCRSSIPQEKPPVAAPQAAAAPASARPSSPPARQNTSKTGAGRIRSGAKAFLGKVQKVLKLPTVHQDQDGAAPVTAGPRVPRSTTGTFCSSLRNWNPFQACISSGSQAPPGATAAECAGEEGPEGWGSQDDTSGWADQPLQQTTEWALGAAQQQQPADQPVQQTTERALDAAQQPPADQPLQTAEWALSAAQQQPLAPPPAQQQQQQLLPDDLADATVVEDVQPAAISNGVEFLLRGRCRQLECQRSDARQACAAAASAATEAQQQHQHAAQAVNTLEQRLEQAHQELLQKQQRVNSLEGQLGQARQQLQQDQQAEAARARQAAAEKAQLQQGVQQEKAEKVQLQQQLQVAAARAQQLEGVRVRLLRQQQDVGARAHQLQAEKAQLEQCVQQEQAEKAQVNQRLQSKQQQLRQLRRLTKKQLLQLKLSEQKQLRRLNLSKLQKLRQLKQPKQQRLKEMAQSKQKQLRQLGRYLQQWVKQLKQAQQQRVAQLKQAQQQRLKQLQQSNKTKLRQLQQSKQQQLEQLKQAQQQEVQRLKAKVQRRDVKLEATAQAAEDFMTQVEEDQKRSSAKLKVFVDTLNLLVGQGVQYVKFIPDLYEGEEDVVGGGMSGEVVAGRAAVRREKGTGGKGGGLVPAVRKTLPEGVAVQELVALAEYALQQDPRYVGMMGVEAALDGKDIVVVMPLVGEELTDSICEPEDPLDVPTKLDILYQLEIAVHDMHSSSRRAHLDIKMANVLLHQVPGEPRLRVALCDMGLNKTPLTMGRLTWCGTRGMMPPPMAIRNDKVRLYIRGGKTEEAAKLLYDLKERYGSTCMTFTDACAADHYSKALVFVEVLRGERLEQDPEFAFAWSEEIKQEAEARGHSRQLRYMNDPWSWCATGDQKLMAALLPDNPTRKQIEAADRLSKLVCRQMRRQGEGVSSQEMLDAINRMMATL